MSITGSSLAKSRHVPREDSCDESLCMNVQPQMSILGCTGVMARAFVVGLASAACDPSLVHATLSHAPSSDLKLTLLLQDFDDCLRVAC